MHLNILDTKRRNFLKKLTPFFKRYYLSGGTAIALLIGHRISIDFDFFSNTPIPKTIDKELEKIGKEVQVLVKNRDEYTAIVDNIKVSFVHYPFPLVEGLEKHHSIITPTLTELGAMKAYTIGRRSVYRDYIDLYAIIHYGSIPLSQIVKVADKKYGKEFNARLLSNQLLDMSDVIEKEIKFVEGFEITEKDMQLLWKKEIPPLFLNN